MDECFYNEIEHMKSIGKLYAASDKGKPKDYEGVIIATNAKIARLIQTEVSTATAARNAGLELTNPMARVKLDFDKDSGQPSCQFFDKDKAFKQGEKQKYEPGKVDRQRINSSNVLPLRDAAQHN